MRRNLLEMEGYEPIEPLEVLSRRSGLLLERIVKLDGNENPYGCSLRTQRALASFERYHIYPDPLQREVRQALEAYTGIPAEHVLAGSGSDELIDLVLRLFLEPGDEVVSCPPTFGMYRFSTEVCGGVCVEVLRDKGYAVDVPGVKAALDARTKLVFIASPNNPTGNTTPEDDILALLETGVVVVVDEAYFEFSGRTEAPWVPRYQNLVVLRSFSKWAGLAGLRAGYGLFPLPIIHQLLKIKPPYNLNVAAQQAILASLADREHLQYTLDLIIAERERLYQKLSQVSFLTPLPSEANFLLCHVEGLEARKVKEGLEREGIFVRYFDTPLLRNCLRISVGRPEHTDRLIEALRRMG